MTLAKNLTPNKTARIAGILYVIPWFFSLFAFFLIDSLTVPGDVAATANKIMASESQYRISIVSDLIVQIAFVFLVLVLYRLLKPVNRTHALLMVILFLVSVPIAMFNMVNQFAPLILLNDAGLSTSFTSEQLQTLVPLFRNLHQVGIMIAYPFWGLWLFPLGYLVFKSGFLPKILGILLMISCFGYLIDFVTFFLFPNIDIAINMYTGWAELFLCLWLLIKGVNEKQWEEHALKLA